MSQIAAENTTGKLWRFCVFVAGDDVRGRLAVENMNRLCNTYLTGKFSIEVIDVHEQPEKATEHRVSACPTVIRFEPLPRRRLIGDLRYDRQAAVALGLVGETLQTQD